MKYIRLKFYLLTLILLGLIGGGLIFFLYEKSHSIKDPNYGMPLDSLHGVVVYYNGKIGNTSGRNKTEDGYNLGLKYQCVEFVKRYYFQHLHHKMPDSYGNAKDFFDKNLADGKRNTKRDLLQFTNPSGSKPQESDLLVYAGHAGNPYGHVSIVSAVFENEIEIIQQNPGVNGKSRVKIALKKEGKFWRIDSDRILGWLRKG